MSQFLHPQLGKVKHSGGSTGNSGCSPAADGEPQTLQAGRGKKEILENDTLR